MKYLYFKFGMSNRQLKYWLQLNGLENPYGTPSAVIFFRKITTQECKDLLNRTKNDVKKRQEEDDNIPSYGVLQNQIRHFIEAGDMRNAVFVSVYQNQVFAFEPANEVFDMSEKEKSNYHAYLDSLLRDKKIDKERVDHIKSKDLLKVMHVKNLRNYDKDIPYILRSLNTNQYFNRGTCREIKESNNWGVVQAIKCVVTQEKTNYSNISSEQVLRLLSPHQFETLMFLIFIDAGLFSPAWRAGSLPDVDIVAINCSSSDPIELGNTPTIKFDKDKEILFQVRRKESQHVDNADYTVSLPTPKRIDERVLTPEWVLNVVKTQPKTVEWFNHSIKWFTNYTHTNSVFELMKH